jgi:SAM-dependent methyltransferase
VTTGTSDPMSLDTQARRAAKANAQADIDAATDALARGDLDARAWCERVSGALARSYLADDDPRWQSGYDGDAIAWREARELVLDGVDRDGAFLDIGCANGYLMECLAEWALERGRRLEMHGLELNPDLARTARLRLPAWASRIHVGNALDWKPPRTYDFVRTGLEYVPDAQRSLLAARLLRDVVAPGGRLIVGPVHAHDLTATIATLESASEARPVAHARTDRNGKTRDIVCVDRR